MPIITMLETKRSPSVGPGPFALGARPVAEPVARDHHLADDLAGREVAHQPLRAGVAERAGERAADLAREAERAAVGLRDVDALDLVRPLARVLARQPQQPFARAVDRDLLGHHLGPRQREMRVRAARAAPSTRWSSRQNASRRAHRASARAAARASCAASPARRCRRAPRRAPRATARPATASPAAHSARAAPSRRSPRAPCRARPWCRRMAAE